MNKTLALLAALGVVVATPVFAADDMAAPAAAKADATEMKTDAKADATETKTDAKADAKEAKTDAKADKKVKDATIPATGTTGN